MAFIPYQWPLSPFVRRKFRFTLALWRLILSKNYWEANPILSNICSVFHSRAINLNICCGWLAPKGGLKMAFTHDNCSRFVFLGHRVWITWWISWRMCSRHMKWTRDASFIVRLARRNSDGNMAEENWNGSKVVWRNVLCHMVSVVTTGDGRAMAYTVPFPY